MTISDFCRFALPLATTAYMKYGVNPISCMAQAALETGWGKSAPGNMYFGIKATASWKGKTQQLRTTEYVNGEKIYQYSTFRAYSTPQESFLDYARLIATTPRYAQALAFSEYDETGNYHAAVAKAGYATAPNYASTLDSVAEKIKNYVSKAQLAEALKKKD